MTVPTVIAGQVKHILLRTNVQNNREPLIVPLLASQRVTLVPWDHVLALVLG